jgi:hypothetical protein
VKKEPLIVCECVLLVISALALASCAGVGDTSSSQRDVAGSHIGKDKVTLYERESDSVSVSTRSHSLVLQHQW